MKKLLIALALTGLLLNISACSNNKSEKAADAKTANNKVKYACPMHPDVTYDKAGKCPKCGMTLVAADSTKNK